MSTERVAVVCARGLGDGLLSMILSHNLALSGVDVTTFSSILCELKEWFPGQRILPFPSGEVSHKTYAAFDTLIAFDYSMVREDDNFGNHLIFLKQSSLDKSKTMVENLQKICETRLALPYCEKDNGIMIPQNLSWREFQKRIVLHPMSADPKKTWPKTKYLKLAKILENDGYLPCFCVSPDEREEWETVVPQEQLPFFPTVHELACFLFESGALIGNDSGVGHLASALNIPTLSLFSRKSHSQLWRPGWNEGTVATPLPLLLGAPLKQKYWKNFLSVTRVKRTFNGMVHPKTEVER